MLEFFVVYFKKLKTKTFVVVLRKINYFFLFSEDKNLPIRSSRYKGGKLNLLTCFDIVQSTQNIEDGWL